ncbi:helix-turn-helix transcriptional regulator [bacterium]|nr:helix-turn-helix transcriptional regulator [bacterium]
MKTIPEISFSRSNRKEIDFDVFTLQSLFARKDKMEIALDEPHRVGFYHILYITEGRGTHYVDFQPCQFQQGSIVVIAKGQVQSFELADDRDGFLILFTESFLLKNLIHSDVLSYHSLSNSYFHSPVIQTEATHHHSFGNIFKEIYDEYGLPDDYIKERLLRLLLKVILLKAERIIRRTTPQEGNSDWFTTFGLFKNHLEQSHHQTRNAEDYADMLNISYKHLNTICKSITGDTAKKCIDEFVVLEIKRQLAISDVSVKELTYFFGFDDPSNFVKYFKKHTSLTPLSFRQSLKV